VKRVGPGTIAWVAIALLSRCAVIAGHSQATALDQRQQAIALEQQGKITEAEIAWRTVLETQPGSAEAFAHLGFLESRQEHYAQAASLYRKALTLNPAMPALRMNLGLALFKAGELKDALRIFEELVKKEPSSSAEAQRLTILIGMSHYGLKDYAAAVPYLRRATARDPQNLPFRLILAHSCLWSKQYQCVLDTYHQILLLNAESAEADMLAGEALDEMQDHDGAIEQFRAAVRANPKEPNVHFGLGYLLWTKGRYEEAAQEFQAEQTNIPNHAQAIVYLADCQIKLNDPKAALSLLERAIRINPNMELAHLDLAAVYEDSTRRDDALRELKTAARLSPNDVRVHYRLARLYQAMGRKEDASIEFEKTKTLTKAADASVFGELNKTRTNSNPTEKVRGAVVDK